MHNWEIISHSLRCVSHGQKIQKKSLALQFFSDKKKIMEKKSYGRKKTVTIFFIKKKKYKRIVHALLVAFSEGIEREKFFKKPGREKGKNIHS